MKRIAITIVLAGCTDLPDYDDPNELAAAEPPSCDNLLANGNLDAGRTSWVASPADVIADDRGLPVELKAHSGNYFAWLGGAPSATRSLSQQITVPASAKTLNFDAKMFVATESETGRTEDMLQIQLLDSAGSALSTPKSLTNLDETRPGSSIVIWADLHVAITNPGRVASLRLLSTNDSVNNTNFFFDTMALVPAGCE
jgi:hypothetical protein